MSAISMIFAGAAHTDRIGCFNKWANPGESTPGHFQHFPGGAAFNSARVAAELGCGTHLESITGTEVAENLLMSVSSQLSDFTIHQQLGVGSSPGYTALLQPDGSLMGALADMQVYEQFDINKMSVLPGGTGWMFVDANLPLNVLETLTSQETAFLTASTVSASKANRLSGSLGRLDMLFTNRAEAAALVACPPERPIAEIACRLGELGLPRAIISDGTAPVTVLNDQSITEVAVDPVEIPVSVIGAGDSLAGATLAALKKGLALDSAVRFAVQVARTVLTVHGPLEHGLLEKHRQALANETTAQS